MTDEGNGAPVPDVDALVSQLRARVEQREREGHYPSTLTEEMRGHFERIARHRAAVDLDVLRRQLDVLDNASSFDAARIPLGSGMPGGQKLHAAVAKLVSRQTQGALEQVQAFADAARVALRTVLSALEEPDGHVHADLVGQLDSLFERLAAFERGPAAPEAAVADLRARVEVLEASQRPAPPVPAALSPVDYAELAGCFEGASPVLHVASGEGGLLEALAAAGIDASGVEPVAELAERSRARGLPVTHGDPVTWLAATPDESLGAVAAVDPGDRMPPGQVVALVVLARDKLRPGGLLVFHGRNPASLYGLAHRVTGEGRSLHPAYLELALREAGFGDVRTAWHAPPGEGERLHELDADPAMNENIARLNRLLYGPQDYTVVATR
ncbi:MAG TPA: methionine biosynthesis protein MetW [Acidimicrobiales bacterium]|nr:methionine biosynthesis protein MetW [Acidimicrobiales bacterium]